MSTLLSHLLLPLLLIFHSLPFSMAEADCSSSSSPVCKQASCYADEDCVSCSVDSWGMAVPECQRRSAAGSSLSGFGLFGVIGGCLALIFVLTTALRVWRARKRRWMQRVQHMGMQQGQAVQMSGMASALPTPVLVYYPTMGAGTVPQARPGTCWILQPAATAVTGQGAGQGQGQWCQVVNPYSQPYAGSAYHLSSPTAPPPYAASEGVQRAPQAGLLWTEVEKMKDDTGEVAE
jgi:hypothetical protein